MCFEYFELQMRLDVARSKKTTAEMELFKLKMSLRQKKSESKEEWDKCQKLILDAAANYKKCKEEQIIEQESVAKRSREVLKRHGLPTRQDQGVNKGLPQPPPPFRQGCISL